MHASYIVSVTLTQSYTILIRMNKTVIHFLFSVAAFSMGKKYCNAQKGMFDLDYKYVLCDMLFVLIPQFKVFLLTSNLSRNNENK